MWEPPTRPGKSEIEKFPEHRWSHWSRSGGSLSESLGQKRCRTKVNRIFRILVPNFAPNFAPNFPRIFEDFSCFVSWETDTRKNSPKIPAVFQCKIPRQTRKKNSQFLLESRQSNESDFSQAILGLLPRMPMCLEPPSRQEPPGVYRRLSAPNRAIWLRLRFVIRIANRKSLAIWDSVNHLRKALCCNSMNRRSALRI